MAQRTTLIHIPQPCQESWAAMTPTATGRHCAACQKTVVDFTQKTDAEILALLARAAGETCGRFGQDQLARPLLPPSSSRGPWRIWLAIALSACGLRTANTALAKARPASTYTTPAPPGKASPPKRRARPAGRTVHGVVRNAATQAGIPGVAVFLKGENRSATTDSAGRFSLRLPGGQPHRRHTLVLHRFGYHSATVALRLASATHPRIALRPDPAATEVEVVAEQVRYQRQYISGAVSSVVAGEMPTPATSQPAAAPPRSFFRWLLHPFRRS